jgi:hypothetical protein
LSDLGQIVSLVNAPAGHKQKTETVRKRLLGTAWRVPRLRNWLIAEKDLLEKKRVIEDPSTAYF